MLLKNFARKRFDTREYTIFYITFYEESAMLLIKSKIIICSMYTVTSVL